MRNMPSPLDGVASPFGALATLPYLSHVIFRAGNGDWSAFGTTEGAPVVTTEKAVFDGTDDAFVADFTQDWSGCSLFVVTKVLSTNSAQDAVIQINPGTTSIISLSAQTIGQFLNQMRLPAASGYGSTLVSSVNPSSATKSIVGELAFLGIMAETDSYIYTMNGRYGAGRTTRPAAINMTRLIVGRNAAGAYNHQEVYEVIALDTTDVAVVESYMKDIAARFGVNIPYVTPLKKTILGITGDSVAVGVGSATVSNRWNWIVARDFLADYTVYAIADSQISPYGFVSPADDAKIAATISRVMTVGNLATKSAVIHFAGANDRAEDVPLGAVDSTDEMTFNGALNDGIADFLANAPADIPLYLCTTVNQYNEVVNGIGLTNADYDSAIRAAVTRANNSRIRLIDTRTLNLASPDDFDDGVHPNDTGNAKMGAYIGARVAASYGINR